MRHDRAGREKGDKIDDGIPGTQVTLSGQSWWGGGKDMDQTKPNQTGGGLDWTGLAGLGLGENNLDLGYLLTSAYSLKRVHPARRRLGLTKP